MAYERRTNNREHAAFNLAMPYLYRINGILNSNYTAFKNGATREFAVNLKQLFRELRPWLIIDEKEQLDEVLELEKLFHELSLIPKDQKEKIWVKMEELENHMRYHFKVLGMLMPKVTDPRFLFGAKQK